MSNFNISCVIWISLLLLTMLYLFCTIKRKQKFESFQNTSLKQAWSKIAPPRNNSNLHIQGSIIGNTGGTLQMSGLQYNDPDGWFQAQNDITVLGQLAKQREQNLINMGLPPEYRDNLSNEWGDTEFARKLSYVTSKDYAVSERHEEDSQTRHKKNINQPTAMGKATVSPGPQQPPHAPGPTPKPPTPKPPAPQPSHWSGKLQLYFENTLWDHKKSPKDFAQHVCGGMAGKTAADCKKAAASKEWDDSKQGGFWNWCVKEEKCIENLWGQLTSNEKTHAPAPAACKTDPHGCAKDICKAPGWCQYKKVVKKTALHVIKELPDKKVHKKSKKIPKKAHKKIPKKAHKKIPKKHSKTPAGVFDNDKLPSGKALEDQNLKGVAAADLRGRGGGARPYPHITRKLALNMAQMDNEDASNGLVPYWLLPGITGAIPALQYYDPAVLGDYSSIAGTGSANYNQQSIIPQQITQGSASPQNSPAAQPAQNSPAAQPDSPSSRPHPAKAHNHRDNQHGQWPNWFHPFVHHGHRLLQSAPKRS